MLIGVCGKAGAGKDTIADYLIKEYGFKKIALADPIKRLVQDVFVLSDNEVYDRVEREKPMEKWGGWSVRKLLQIIGTELFRKNIDESIWVKSLWYRVQSQPSERFVISDVRFPNELSFLKDNSSGDFFSIKVTRDGHSGNVGVVGHESEAYDLTTDYVLQNNESYDSLFASVDDVMKFKGINKVV